MWDILLQTLTQIGICGSHSNEAAELVNWHPLVPVDTLTLISRLNMIFHNIFCACVSVPVHICSFIYSFVQIVFTYENEDQISVNYQQRLRPTWLRQAHSIAAGFMRSTVLTQTSQQKNAMHSSKTIILQFHWPWCSFSNWKLRCPPL